MNARDRLSWAGAAATALTSSALSSVFLGARWLPALVGVVLVVATLSVLGRRARLPAVLSPVLLAAGVVTYVTAVFAGSAATLRCVPGPAAVAVLRQRLDEGFADIQALAPPVPARPGVLLVTVAGVGLVALAVDVLAATLRRPPLAGLPLLALFAVPAALAPQGGGVVPFAFSVAGFLLLLGADNRDRLASWGRPLRTTAQLESLSRLTAEYPQEQPTGAMGRRIGIGAISLALLVPMALPALGTPLFGGGSGPGAGPGRSSSVTTYNPIVRLHDQLSSPRATVLLRVRADSAGPTGYLRMAGLDMFDGRTWSQGSLRATKDDRVSRRDALPAPTLRGPTARTSISVTKALDARWLPLPYQSTAIDIPGDWRYENRTGTVFSTRDNTRGQSYTVSSARLVANPAKLNNAQLGPADQAVFSPYVAYPPRLSPILRATVDGIVSRAKASTPYQQAVAIQDYFRSGRFTYSLSVPAGNSDDAIVNFLQARRGFCEQFAATMALFARMQGIPARVAVGFTYGERAADGEYVVTSKDAHAWPELFFSGAGWLPFEPTPVAGRGQTVPPAYTRGEGAGTAAAGGVFTPQNNTPRDLSDRRFGNRLDRAAASTAASERTGQRSSAVPWPWLVALAALVLLGTPAALRAGVRYRRWHGRRGGSGAGTAAGAAHAAWQDLREDAADFGWRWPASASPRAAARWLRERVPLPPEASAGLDLLVAAKEWASFAPASSVAAGSSAAGVSAGELRAATARLRAAMAREAGVLGRGRAAVAPRSTLERIGALGTRVAAAGDRIDRTLARWFRSALRRRPALR